MTVSNMRHLANRRKQITAKKATFFEFQALPEMTCVYGIDG
jgi:hypothetical protein